MIFAVLSLEFHVIKFVNQKNHPTDETSETQVDPCLVNQAVEWTIPWVMREPRQEIDIKHDIYWLKTFHVSSWFIMVHDCVCLSILDPKHQSHPHIIHIIHDFFGGDSPKIHQKPTESAPSGM